MWTRYLLDTRDWSGAVTEWTVDTTGDEATHLEYDFTRAFMAAERGALADTRTAERAYDDVAQSMATSDSGSTDPETLELEQRNRVLGLELRGLIAVKSGTVDSGLTLLARAAATQDSMAYEFGPPFVDEPAHELLGESLLGVHRFGDAEREFRAALKRTPAPLLTHGLGDDLQHHLRAAPHVLH
jgi:hypothetical protein